MAALMSPVNSSTNVTFVRLKKNIVKPYCPKQLKGSFNKIRCASICIQRKFSCSAFEYSDGNCTLWKYIMFEKDPAQKENLYLKDLSNSFHEYSCFSESATKDMGKCKY